MIPWNNFFGLQVKEDYKVEHWKHMVIVTHLPMHVSVTILPFPRQGDKQQWYPSACEIKKPYKEGSVRPPKRSHGFPCTRRHHADHIQQALQVGRALAPVVWPLDGAASASLAVNAEAVWGSLQSGGSVVLAEGHIRPGTKATVQYIK